MIKRNSVPKLSKGFYIACDDIQADKRFVVYAGRDQFPLGRDVMAIPLPRLMNELLAR
ncbi:hypothetical protein SAMN04487894_103169 [Niabella drilacis]|uniref:Uncharacterized protein n=1 Tax=Niabella drilacis (strain DSM 25811 / CCM 8410 / CCUG 62505 / LMG 26954 / E90) TaxID=1285928 RepID=A0A1G6N874_NIADE|nr:hypothetical protein SAMN04487894_103169 [Niabella drilacis]